MEQKLAAGEFFGQKLRSCQVAGFILTEARFPAKLAFPTHYHENAYFRLVIEGVATDASPAGRFSSTPGTMVYHPVGERHASSWHVAGRTFNIELPSSQKRLQEYAGALGGRFDFPSGPQVRLALRILREFQQPDVVSPLNLEAQILELIAGLCKSALPAGAQRAPAWLRRIRELLHDRFAENVSLDQIAAAAGVHPGHAARMFRRFYRTTPGEYVRRLRVERACRELRANDRPIADIAMELGFFDQSHFSGVFRRHTGLTPREYRRALPGR
jgi:AraC family transcriptional regulator